MGDSEHMLASAADHLETRQLTSITCHISISAAMATRCEKLRRETYSLFHKMSEVLEDAAMPKMPGAPLLATRPLM